MKEAEQMEWLHSPSDSLPIAPLKRIHDELSDDDDAEAGKKRQCVSLYMIATSCELTETNNGPWQAGLEHEFLPNEGDKTYTAGDQMLEDGQQESEPGPDEDGEQGDEGEGCRESNPRTNVPGLWTVQVW